MKFKSIVNLGLLSAVMMFASCGDNTNADDTVEINELVQLEDFAFQKEVSEEEIRLEEYIVELNGQIELLGDGNTDELKQQKVKAVKMLLELRSDYVELTDETAAKWVVFQEGLNNLIPTAEEEINYAQDMDSDNSDS